MKKTAYLLFTGLMIIVILGSCLSCNSSPQVTKWRMATSWTADNLFYTRGALAICERVKQLSGGRLVIEPYPAGSLVGALDVMDAVSTGKVEIGHSWSGYWVDKERSFELFTSIPDQMVPQEWTIWLYGPSRGIDLWKELYKNYNIVPFPGGLVGPEFGFFTRKPVRSLDDFKGLKLRVTGLASDVLKELGATTLLTAPGDIKSAMEKGEIDGFEFSVPAVDWPMGFQEVAHYVSLPSWHQPSAMFETIVNQDAYNKLPDDLKAILESACKEISIIDYFAGLEGENTEYLNKFLEAGIQINTLDASAIQKINEVTNRLADQQAAKNEFYARVLKSQRDFLTQYRRWENWQDFKIFSGQDESERIFYQVQQNIQNELNLLDRDMAGAAQKLAGLKLDSLEARNILSGLLEGRSYIVDTSTIDRNGKMVAIEPSAYHEFEGSDISMQKQVIQVFQTGKPVLSQNFVAVEGFQAADLEYPIISAGGEITGSLSVLFKPDILIGNVVNPAIRGKSFTMWAMQPDGLDIFDDDESEIGRNIFTDPLYQSYTQLLELCKQMVNNRSGSGQYEFLDIGLKNNVKKDATWVTVELYGTEWRLILIRIVS